MTTCLICGASTTALAITAPTPAGTAERFQRCTTCGTVFDAPFLSGTGQPADNHTYGPASIQWYAELGAALEPLAHNIELLQRAGISASGHAVRFIDVGCALGIGLRLAELLSWEAIGVEPSAFGAAGREMLKVDIRIGYLEAAGIEPHSANAVLLSEVIEHVPDPVGVLKHAYTLLAPGGVLLFTTPNADTLVDGSENDVMDTLSPTAHLCIFSSSSIALLLTLAGIPKSEIQFSGGRSGRKTMTVIARNGQAPRELTMPNVVPASVLVTMYLEQFADDSSAHPHLRNGARYQLMQHHHRARQFVQMDQRLAQLMRRFRENALMPAQLDSLAQCDGERYLAQIPAYTSVIHLITAQRLLASGQPANALQHFETAERLHRIESDLGSFPKMDYLWRCYMGQLHAIERLATHGSASKHQAIDRLIIEISAAHEYSTLNGDDLELFQLAKLSKQLRQGKIAGVFSTLKHFVELSKAGITTRSARVVIRRLRALM
jgi:SAM-dependent methyltransferase